MSNQPRKSVDLIEFSPRLLDLAELPHPIGLQLWREYDQRQKRVSVEFPSPKTLTQWQITSLGWVGYIPLTSELGFRLNSKVPLINIFGMLEYAYRLKSFHLLDSLMECESLEDLYERLASILALRILDRARKGLYRSYLHKVEQLPYLRGRMDIERAIRYPCDVKLRCGYEEHTADIEENQILAWTLFRILRTSLCTEQVVSTVRQAYRSLQRLVSLHPFSPNQCIGRQYNRLNYDYQPLHALCRFFLEQTGPAHVVGEHQMIPFLVDMARLFELFVCEWLRKHLFFPLIIKAQERVLIGREHDVHFDIDLVVYDTETGVVQCILDTKYKAPAATPATDDIAQVVAYAEAKNCREAILLYPAPLSESLDAFVGKIRVRSLVFDLGGELEQAGRELLRNLLGFTECDRLLNDQDKMVKGQQPDQSNFLIS